MGKTLKECYEVLGLNLNASQDEVKKAYRQLALECHPDKNPDDPEATNKFQELGYAYRKITSGDEEEEEENGGEDFNFMFDWKKFFFFLFREEIYNRVFGSSHHCTCGRHHGDYNDDDDDEDDDEEDEETSFFEFLFETGQDYESEDPFTEEEMAQFKKFDSLEEQREFNKRVFCAPNKSTKPKKETKTNKQPKVKSSKQLKAEQWKRRKEMSEIAEQIEIKKKEEQERVKEHKTNNLSRNNDSYNFSNVDLSHLDGGKKKKTQPKPQDQEQPTKRKKKKKKDKHSKTDDDFGTMKFQQPTSIHQPVVTPKPFSNTTATSHPSNKNKEPTKVTSTRRPYLNQPPPRMASAAARPPAPTSRPHAATIRPPAATSRPPAATARPAAARHPAVSTVHPLHRNGPTLYPPCTSNIWQKRQENQHEVQRLRPSTEEEELRQLELAIQMSQKQAEIEEKNRKIASLEEELIRKETQAQRIILDYNSTDASSSWKADTIDSFGTTGNSGQNKQEDIEASNGNFQNFFDGYNNAPLAIGPERNGKQFESEEDIVQGTATDEAYLGSDFQCNGKSVDSVESLYDDYDDTDSEISPHDCDAEDADASSLQSKNEVKLNVLNEGVNPTGSCNSASSFEDDLPASDEVHLLDTAVISYQVREDENLCPYGRDCCLGKKCTFTHPPPIPKKKPSPSNTSGNSSIPTSNVAVNISSASWEMPTKKGISSLWIGDPKAAEDMSHHLHNHNPTDDRTWHQSTVQELAVKRKSQESSVIGCGYQYRHDQSKYFPLDTLSRPDHGQLPTGDGVYVNNHESENYAIDDEDSSDDNNHDEAINQKAPLDGRFADLSSNESSSRIDTGEDWEDELEGSPCPIGFNPTEKPQIQNTRSPDDGKYYDDDDDYTLPPPGFGSKGPTKTGIVNPLPSGLVGAVSSRTANKVPQMQSAPMSSIPNGSRNGSAVNLPFAGEYLQSQQQNMPSTTTPGMQQVFQTSGIPPFQGIPVIPGLMPPQIHSVVGQTNSSLNVSKPGNRNVASAATSTLSAVNLGLPNFQQMANIGIPGMSGQGTVPGSTVPTSLYAGGTSKGLGNSMQVIPGLTSPFASFPGIIPNQGFGMTGPGSSAATVPTSFSTSVTTKGPRNVGNPGIPGVTLPYPMFPGNTPHQTVGVGSHNVRNTNASYATTPNVQNTGVANCGINPLTGIPTGIQNSGIPTGIQNHGTNLQGSTTAQIPLPGTIPGIPLIGINPLLSPLALQLYYQTLLQMQMTGLNMSLGQPGMPGHMGGVHANTAPQNTIKTPNTVGYGGGGIDCQTTGPPAGQETMNDNVGSSLQARDLRRPSSVPRAMACSERRDS